MKRLRNKCLQLTRCTRGGASVEYCFLLTLSVTLLTALVTLTPRLAENRSNQLQMMGQSYP